MSPAGVPAPRDVELKRSALGLPQLFCFVRPRVVVFQTQGGADFGRGGLEYGGVILRRSTQAMPLTDRDVVADARLHLDVVQLTVRTFKDQDAMSGDERLGLDLDVVDLQTQSFSRVHVDELRRIRGIRWR